MSWTNRTQSISTWTNETTSSYLGLILTDALDEIWLGASEDEVLVWNVPTSWTNLTKS